MNWYDTAGKCCYLKPTCFSGINGSVAYPPIQMNKILLSIAKLVNMNVKDLKIPFPSFEEGLYNEIVKHGTIK